VRAMRLIRHRRRHLSKKIKHRENLTMMLVTVVSVFIVCQLPDLGIRVAYTCYEFAPRVVVLNVTSLRYANAASNALLTLNSAVNFLVYCLVGRKFRRILLNEMCIGARPASLRQQIDSSETELTHHHCSQQHQQPKHHVAAWSTDRAKIGGDCGTANHE
jgi:hypothetical protein